MKWLKGILALLVTVIVAGCSGTIETGTATGGSESGPSVATFAPAAGVVGTTVTISGSNFSTNASSNIVSFNGTPASVTSSTASQIVVTVPAGAKSGTITVKVGTQTATSAASFTVTTQMGGATQLGTTLSLSGAVSTLAGSSGNFGFADEVGTAAKFNNIGGMTTDGTNLYVADGGNHTIRKVVIATGAVTTLAGTAGVTGSSDGVSSAARFNTPSSITTDGTNLYVTDFYNFTIRKIQIATGTVTTLAGTAGASGSLDGAGAAARFHSLNSITTDGTNLYVADNGSIRKISIATGTVTTIAGAAGIFGSVDGIGVSARFVSLSGITTDGSSLYITDSQTVRKMNLSTGAVTTLAGAPGQSGSTDGTGSAARFSSLSDITTDGTSLYVSDLGNNTIRRIVITTGAVTTIAGTPGASGATDGIGAAARFTYPGAITTDGESLFVSASFAIRRIQ